MLELPKAQLECFNESWESEVLERGVDEVPEWSWMKLSTMAGASSSLICPFQTSPHRAKRPS